MMRIMPDALATPLRAAPLTGAAAFRDAATLYTRVFDYSRAEFSLNPNLLSALTKNGGSAVGVYDDERLVGFAYGFPGRDRTGREFHYSQAAVVDPAYQGRGIGRLLKTCQREVALSWGQQRMRWTFDPLLARNAHFNFAALQAEGTGYALDYYDRPGTDRIIVDWSLERTGDPFAAARVLQPPALRTADWGRVIPADDDGARSVWVPIPVDSTRLSPSEHLCARIRTALQQTFEMRLVLVNCVRIDDETAAYLATEDVR